MPAQLLITINSVINTQVLISQYLNLHKKCGTKLHNRFTYLFSLNDFLKTARGISFVCWDIYIHCHGNLCKQNAVVFVIISETIPSVVLHSQGR